MYQNRQQRHQHRRQKQHHRAQQNPPAKKVLVNRRADNSQVLSYLK